jgi:cobalt transporter subunit CbtB
MTQGDRTETQAAHGRAQEWSGFVRAWPVALAALIGVGLLYGVGFAGSATIHDAAHDSRHALSFPCH